MIANVSREEEAGRKKQNAGHGVDSAAGYSQPAHGYMPPLEFANVLVP